MRSIIVPEEIAPQVEALVEIYLREGQDKHWKFAAATIEAMLELVKEHGVKQ